ncbi:hypothetical protein BJ991_000382 [Microbacterium immunditiarum]|uniref:Uncharacterized protein n=1 Tax=Microbacterium immunditiarum TaxID=337480 RepID=A0A7Y9KK11_9MICO|nr:hypothetical protein [Microbacterium immunditiarum]
MLILIAFGALAVAGIVATFARLTSDDFHPVATDRTRLP